MHLTLHFSMGDDDISRGRAEMLDYNGGDQLPKAVFGTTLDSLFNGNGLKIVTSR